MWLVTLLATVVLVDFASGLVHWVEDTFWEESTPVFGSWMVTPNVVHHQDATAFVTKSWFESSWDLLAIGALVALSASWLDELKWPVWVFIVFGVNANQIHKWSHTPNFRLPVPVRILQGLWLLQGSKHHAHHHRGDKNSAYCLITPFLNPILDALGFWRALERATIPLFGAPRRIDIADGT